MAGKFDLMDLRTEKCYFSICPQKFIEQVIKMCLVVTTILIRVYLTDFFFFNFKYRFIDLHITASFNSIYVKFPYIN